MSLLSRRALVRAVAPALLALGILPAAAAADPPPLTAQPSSVDFGIVPADWGEQSSQLWIQNSGPDPLQLASAWIDGPSAFRVSGDMCAGQTLASGQGCSVGVGFDPFDGSASDATLHVPAPGWDDLHVPLSGVGGVRQVTLSPQALAFGSVAVGESATLGFTLTSSGTLPFQSFVALPTGGDVGAFRVERDGCSLQQLVPGQPCSVSVRFAPLAAGAVTATLLLIGGESEPAVVPLHGTGVAPAVAPPAPPAGSGAPPAAAEPPAPPRPVAGVAFAAPAGRPARYAHGRIELGRVRCTASERCVATVRPRVYAVDGSGATIASTRSDVVLWRLRRAGTPMSLAVPAGLHGRPALLVARVRTRATGHAASTVVHVVALAPARR